MARSRIGALGAAVLAFAACAHANIYVPRAKLAGETVSVLLRDSATVTGTFEFQDLVTRDQKVAYVPIFAADGDDPMRVLVRAGLTLTANGIDSEGARPCDPPRATVGIPSGIRPYWFAVSLDQLVPRRIWNGRAPFIIRFAYSQSLFNGRFFYLPVIVEQDVPSGDSTRAWNYQMHVRSPSHLVKVLSSGTDYERLNDGITVYLKDSELVALK